MNVKKILALMLCAMMLLSLAACGAKGNDKQADMSGDSSAMTGEPKTAEEALALHKELLERENALLSENAELWEKVFMAADKGMTMQEDGKNYGDFLLDTVEAAKEQFTDKEYEWLKESATEISNIENKLTEHNLMKKTKRKVVKFGQSINLGDFRVEFIKTNHSIVDAAALAIYSPAGIVVHTGDFKVDYTPVYGDAIDLQRFAEIGKKGVLALMCDSTNAERPGFTPSEKTVGKTFDTLFEEHKNTRIFVATFASNVDRVQQIINTAYKFGRKVAVEGRSMVNIISVASELGYLNVPENTLIETDQLKNYPREKTTIITTGSQGESMAALSRMAADVHRKVTIQPNDTIIFSSNPIPGNEKSVSRVINELSAKGAEVIFQDAHVSGHACQEELKLIYSLVKPKYAIPVHGEYRHLKANAGVAKSLGIPKENVFIMQSGEVLELCDDYAKVVDKVHTGAILVDGLGVGDVGNIVLRDRQHLAEDGIIIVVLTLERRTNRLLAGPDIVSRGFVYVRESEELMDDARKAVSEALEKCLKGRHTDWNKIKLVIRDAMNDYIWKKTKRRPMVIPIIMDVDV